MLSYSWATGQPMLGGSGMRLVIADGDQIQVPSISTLQQKERDRLEMVLAAIRALAPAKIWEEMQARQR